MKKILPLLPLLFFITLSFTFISVGQKAPLFTGQDINDNAINLADYHGKTVLLDFWASWCGPCQQEFPFLVKLYEKYKKDDFVVLAVNIDNKRENMLHFLNKKSLRNALPIIFDPDKKIPPLYDLEAMPTSVFIDKKGIIRYVHDGFNESSKEEFKEELKTLLNEK